MDHAFIRADPAKLVIAGHSPPKPRGVFADPLKLESFDERRERLDCGAAQFVPAADREGESVAGEPGSVGLENAIGRRIIGRRVHRVRPVETTRSRKANVERLELGDPGHSRTPPRRLPRPVVSIDCPRPVATPPEVDRSEELMCRLQRPLPNAAEGAKWVPMTRIFSLDEQ